MARAPTHDAGDGGQPQALAVEFREATKRYPGASESAVDAVTIEAPAGELCVLVGPSGWPRALAANPGVMLMDEPFGAVDPINRERLQNEFLRLQAELRKTILFVTTTSTRR